LAFIQDSWPGGGNHHPALRVGGGFFLGASLFLAAWRLASALSGEARLSLYVVATALCAICALEHGSIPSLLRSPRLRRGLGYAAIWLILAEVVVASVWLRLYDGSDHSQLYGGIASYVFSKNMIPVLGMHYGQSMLSASISLISSSNLHNLSLHLFLTISVFMLGVTFYGALRTYLFSPTMSAAGTFVLMFGNYALTTVHGVSISTLSPNIICGYSDDIMSMGSFTFFTIWLDSYFSHEESQVPRPDFTLLCPAILGASWNLTAPQNILSGLALLSSLPILFSMLRPRWLKRSVFLLAVFTISFLATSQLGGAFSTRARQDPAFTSITSAQYRFNPEIPFAIGRTAIAPLWHIRPAFDGGFPAVLIWQVEESLWSGLRICFFPIAGIVLLWIQLHGREPDSGPITMQPLKRFLPVAAITFASGFGLAFLVDFAPPFDKWGLNKFMVNSFVLGMFALLAAFRLHLGKADTLRRRVCIAFAIFLITAPPLISIATAVGHSVTAPQHLEAFPKRVAVLAR